MAELPRPRGCIPHETASLDLVYEAAMPCAIYTHTRTVIPNFLVWRSFCVLASLHCCALPLLIARQLEWVQGSGAAVVISRTQGNMATREKQFSLPVDSEHKALKINLLSFALPHMRAFHLCWFGFFTSFVSTFAPAAMIPVVREDLGLSKADLGNAGAVLWALLNAVVAVCVSALAHKCPRPRAACPVSRRSCAAAGFQITSTTSKPTIARYIS